MFAQAKAIITDEKLAALQNIPKAEFDALYNTLQDELKNTVTADIENDDSPRKASLVKTVFFNLVKYFLRDQVLAGKPRVDGR